MIEINSSDITNSSSKTASIITNSSTIDNNSINISINSSSISSSSSHMISERVLLNSSTTPATATEQQCNGTSSSVSVYNSFSVVNSSSSPSSSSSPNTSPNSSIGLQDNNTSSSSSEQSEISSSSSEIGSCCATTTANEQQMVNKIKIEDSVTDDLKQLQIEDYTPQQKDEQTKDCLDNNISNSSNPNCNTDSETAPPQQYLTNVQIFQRSPIFEKLKPPAMKEHVNTFPKLERITPIELEWMKQVMIWNTAERDCRKLCRLGIPPRLRGFIWRLCSGAIELEKKNIGVYHFFLTKNSDEYEYKISKDIARTFPKVPYFSREQGQIALFNILKAYSVMDPEIGYTQGMSFIAAVLLSEMDEIESFWTFTGVMKNYKLSTLYSNDLSLLKMYLYVIDRLIEIKLPKLFSHLKEIGVTPVLFASEWISTLFTYNFDIEISKRFWDIFFVEGRFYLHRLVLAILAMNEKQLIQSDFENAVELLKKVGHTINPDLVIQVADNFQVSINQIELLEEEFGNGPSDYF